MQCVRINISILDKLCTQNEINLPLWTRVLLYASRNLVVCKIYFYVKYLLKTIISFEWNTKPKYECGVNVCRKTIIIFICIVFHKKKKNFGLFECGHPQMNLLVDRISN